jgi:hypothetical protein
MCGRQHDQHRLLDQREDRKSFAVTDRWADECYVDVAAAESRDLQRRVALLWREKHTRIAFPIGPDDRGYERLEIRRTRHADTNASGLAARAALHGLPASSSPQRCRK